jgi:hypothetical protein
MNTTDVKTPNGYIASVTADLTYRQYTELQNILTSKMTVDPSTTAVNNISASVVQEANQKALTMLLVKLVDPQGKELPDPGNAINDIPAVDGIAISEKINEIWSNVSISKKKGI